MRKVIFGVVLLAALAVMPSAASAGQINLGDPVCPVGDWSQRFQENGIYGPQYFFDQIFVDMVTDAATTGFLPPGIRNFSVGGWQATGTDQSTLAWGPAQTYMQWDYVFSPVSAVSPTVFDYYVHLKTAAGADAGWWLTRTTYNGGWSYADLGMQRTSPVPEPATLSLLGLGLVGVARAVRRRK